MLTTPPRYTPLNGLSPHPQHSLTVTSLDALPHPWVVVSMFPSVLTPSQSLGVISKTVHVPRPAHHMEVVGLVLMEQQRVCLYRIAYLKDVTALEGMVEGYHGGSLPIQPRGRTSQD